jgi:hypothetical protein
MTRQPMTPGEFDAKCRELIRWCPWLSETSGRRSKGRNDAVNGDPDSKHLIGMARDFAAPSKAGLEQASLQARELEFWHTVHDVGSGKHLHVQGLAPGPVPEWWTDKFT